MSGSCQMPLFQQRIGKGSSFGTFGELLQGRLADCNLDFLVTFPIECYSKAVFTTYQEGHALEIFPQDRLKSKKMASIILRHLGLPPSGRLEIESDICVGKGLASSSADLVATARAIESCFGISISNELLQSFMAQIEPSDGVMYPGVTSFYHRKVKLRAFLGELPLITVIGIDEGGEVNTIEFNKLRKPYTRDDRKEYQELLEILSAAVCKQDMPTIGKVATRSAQLNQKLCPKKYLDYMLRLYQEVEGLGVIIAHSGTCIAIMLSNDDTEYSQKLQIAKNRLQTLTNNVLVFNSWNSKKRIG